MMLYILSAKASSLMTISSLLLTEMRCVQAYGGPCCRGSIGRILSGCRLLRIRLHQARDWLFDSTWRLAGACLGHPKKRARAFEIEGMKRRHDFCFIHPDHIATDEYLTP